MANIYFRKLDFTIKLKSKSKKIGKKIKNQWQVIGNSTTLHYYLCTYKHLKHLKHWQKI